MAIEVDQHPRRSPAVGLQRRADRAKPAATVSIVAALLIATVLVTWLATGVSLGDVGRFVAFEALWVCLPGCMLYLLLCHPHRGWLSVLALGWPLGHAIEIGSFALAAALGRRELFDWLPLLATAAMGPFLARPYAARGRLRLTGFLDGLAQRVSGARGMPIAVLGITIAVGVAVIALRYFVPYPLPGHVPSVAYLPDDVYAISLAAEALHHWPLTEPYVAGQPLHFYPGVFIHIAAVSQAVGIPPATVVLRLFPTSMVFLVVLQLWLVCRQLGGSEWVGAVAAVLFVIVGELNLDVTRFENDGINFFNMLGEAPTNALGFSFFLALFALVQRQLAAEDAVDAGDPPVRQPPGAVLGSLAMVAVLAYAGSAVKTQAVGDVVGGLGAILLIGRFFGMRLARLQWGHALAGLACIAVYYELTLAGGVSPYRVQPFAFVHYTVFDPLFPAHSIGRLLLLAGAAAAVYACLFVPLLGALWLLRRPGRDRRSIAFAFAVFAVAVAVCTVLAGAGDNEVDFLVYGYVALVPFSALGLTRLWEQTPGRARRRIGLAFAAVLLAGLAAAGSSHLLVETGTLTNTSLIPAGEGAFGSRRLAWGLWYVTVYGLLAIIVGVACLGLERTLVGALRSRAARVAACCIPLVLALALVKPIAVAFPEAWKTVVSRRAVRDSSEDQGMSAALFAGLLWVRDHTSDCTVLAVNNHSLKAHIVDSRYFYYSAFAERPVFLESWEYPAHWNKAQPFPARMALNTRAVSHGEASALRDLARLGVGYVLVDKTHGRGAQEPASASTLVFANPALDVYRLTAPAGDADRRPGCGSLAAA
jgi:hypothetical protein